MSTTTKNKRTQSRALSWFGSDATVSAQYAALLADRKHVTVPFCGGLSIVAHLVETAGEIACNDLHALAMNFYTCISDAGLRYELVERLTRTPFHESQLHESQEMCKAHDVIESSDSAMAFHYFVTCWMGRSGKAGTNSEFNGGLAMRWDASGGSSPLRFQTAVRSIQEVWGPICERCSFLCMDWRDVLAKVKDDQKNGVYADPPWVGAGDEYSHKFTEQEHRDLAEALSRFDQTKVVLRYDDHPLVWQLYGGRSDAWVWRIKTLISRNQANNGVGELCITNSTEGV